MERGVAAYVFGDFRLDLERAELMRGGARIAVEPQVFDLIRLLASRHGALVTRDEILAEIWQGRIVSDAALSSRVKAARQALGDSGRAQTMIETRHGRGFRFVPEVTAERAAGAGAPDAGQAAAPAAAAARTPAPAPVLAVLPFDSFSADPESRVLADGLTEELITGLARFRVFPVIARNSVFAWRGRSHDVREVARALGADYVIEGSLMRLGGRVRVHVQLIEAATGLHVWADRPETGEGDIFAVFDTICDRIVSALHPEILEAERQKAQRLNPSNMTAWQLYVRAQGVLEAPTRAANAEARALLERAAELEPDAPRLHSSIALTHLWDIHFNWTEDPRASFAAAQAAVARVGERVAEDAWSLLVQGGCLLMMRDHEGAIATLEQALRADPNSSRAHGLLALALALAGRHDDALAEAAAADRLSPSDLRGVVWHNATAVSHFARRDYARALAAGQRIAALHPDYVVGHRIVAASAARLGQPEVAAAAVREVLRIMPGVGMRTAIASVPYRERAEAEDYLAALIEAGLPA